jgi:sulfatase maturation enzyme AslB (radical SAM superfamily)
MSNIKNSLYEPLDWSDYDYWGQDTAAIETPSQVCGHEYVNVSFNHIIMICKHCGQEEPKDGN